MFPINILTLEKHFHNISYKTIAYNSHNIRNSTRDKDGKKNDLLSDS